MSEEQVRTRIHVMMGIGVIGFGVLLLLGQLGIISFTRLYKFWPLILIIFGLGKLFTRRAVLRSRNESVSPDEAVDKLLVCKPAQDWLFGVLLIIFGVNFQLAMLSYTHLSWNHMWPFLVIAAGVGIIYWSLENHKGAELWSTAEINQVNFFGGGEFRITSQDFRGGKLLNVCGGFKLDLTEAGLHGNEAVIDVSALLGGGEIIVPREWEVSIRGTAFFAGYNDETRRNPPEPGRPKKTLVIKGVWIFGGINVKN